MRCLLSRNGRKDRVVYNDVVLEVPSGRISQTHSVLAEDTVGMPFLGRLEDLIDGGTLYRMPYGEVAGLYSVLHRNYQICNGGLVQYYFNGFGKGRPSFSKNGVPLYDEAGQVDFLYGMDDLAELVLDERELSDWNTYLDLADEQLDYGIDPDEWDDDFEDRHDLFDDYDRRYYKVNYVFEKVAEVYAQYLVKIAEVTA